MKLRLAATLKGFAISHWLTHTYIYWVYITGMMMMMIYMCVVIAVY